MKEIINLGIRNTKRSIEGEENIFKEKKGKTRNIGTKMAIKGIINFGGGRTNSKNKKEKQKEKSNARANYLRIKENERKNARKY